MLTRITPFFIAATICLLIVACPMIGTLGHACEDEHEHSSATAGTDHDDSHCGCLCHAAAFAVLPDVHEASALPMALAQHIHTSSTFHTYLPAIERPPRLYS